ncbi:MAG: putative mucin-2-like [Parcubacteria group bacterium Gr01-1014_44]|nr:MAG: putative mucin-2-like [Parcubacteria group bacterium Gr01-1014_44]
MNQKGFANIAFIVLVVVLVGVVGYFALVKKSPEAVRQTTTPTPTPTQTQTTPTPPNTVTPPASPTSQNPTPSTKTETLKITSISPTTATAGTIITVNGKGFSIPNPVRRTGMSYIPSDAVVVMQSGNGEKIPVFTLQQGVSHSDSVITFTLPSRICKYDERGCGNLDPDSFYFNIVPGTYSLFVQIPNTNLISNSVDIVVKQK